MCVLLSVLYLGSGNLALHSNLYIHPLKSSQCIHLNAYTDLRDAGSQRENTSHLEEYHTNVAVSPAEENTFDIENVGMFSGMFLTQSLQSSLFT